MLRVLLKSFTSTAIGLSFILASCATTETHSGGVERTAIDVKEEQMSILNEQLQRQSKQIEALTNSVEDLKREISSEKTKSPADAAKPAELKSVPVQTVIPPSGAVDEDTSKAGDRSQAESGEVVADSTDESMHFYFEGIQYQKEQRYDESNKAFQAFLKAAPDHVYADRAQFCVAQNYFRNREFSLAVLSTNLLESKFPTSFKLPDALLTRGMSYLRMGQQTEAQVVFQDLVRRFPKEPAAVEATERLVELRPNENNQPVSKKTEELDF